MPVSANIDPKLLKENFGVSEIEVDGKKYPVTADMPFGLVYDEIALIKLVACIHTGMCVSPAQLFP